MCAATGGSGPSGTQGRRGQSSALERLQADMAPHISSSVVEDIACEHART